MAIVTGANSGIGFDTARVLAEHGATVVLACRNTRKAEARASIVDATGSRALAVAELDLCSLASVRAFATAFSKDYDQLDLLINNAGNMVPPYSLSEDGFESQLAANYLGHFALTGLLVDKLEATAGSLVVSLSSIAHRYGKIHFKDMQFSRRYNAPMAYAQSKLACLMFAVELQQQFALSGCQTISVAAHPASPKPISTSICQGCCCQSPER